MTAIEDWSIFQWTVVFLLVVIGWGVSKAITLLTDIEYSVRRMDDRLDDE